ncbi:MAG: hypothetical protein F6K09_23525 [Merismopedia sp. SIO2A8]|nr:hypothetical protein [Merismopedia sp. SIO2A8]
MVAVSARIFLPSDLAAPAPIEGSAAYLSSPFTLSHLNPTSPPWSEMASRKAMSLVYRPTRNG